MKSGGSGKGQRPLPAVSRSNLSLAFNLRFLADALGASGVAIQMSAYLLLRVRAERAGLRVPVGHLMDRTVSQEPAITRIPHKRAKRRFSNAIKKPGATPVELLSAAHPTSSVAK